MSGQQKTSQGITPARIWRGLRRRALNSLEWAHNVTLPPPRMMDGGSELPEITEIRKHALPRTDISDHLLPLFLEALAVQPAAHC